MRLSLNTSNNMNSLLFSQSENGGGKSICYTPYGGSKKILNLPVGFNGQRVDPVSQRYHLGNGARSYNPVLMRFNSPDSLSPFGAGGINPYAYCLGDPINRSDPSGHISVLGTTTSIIGLVLGALSIFAGGAGIATIALSLVSLGTGAASVGMEISANSKIDSRPADAKNEESTATVLGIISAVTAAAAMISTKVSSNFFKKKTVIEKYNTQTSVSRRSSVASQASWTSAGSESVSIPISDALRSSPRPSMRIPTAEVPSPPPLPGPSQGTRIIPSPRPAAAVGERPLESSLHSQLMDELKLKQERIKSGMFRSTQTKVAKQYIGGRRNTAGTGSEDLRVIATNIFEEII